MKFVQRSPVFSPDEKLIAFHAATSSTTRQIWILPFQLGRPAPESEWIPVNDGKSLDRDPALSPDDNMLYWLADRGVEAHFVELSGSVEIMINLGVADAIVTQTQASHRLLIQGAIGRRPYGAKLQVVIIKLVKKMCEIVPVGHHGLAHEHALTPLHARHGCNENQNSNPQGNQP